jgi:phage tail protein X
MSYDRIGYSQLLIRTSLGAYCGTFRKSLDANHGITNLIKLYGFAEQICLPDLLDYTASTIFSNNQKAKSRFNLHHIQTIYKYTAPNPLLRNWGIQALRRLISLDKLTTTSSTVAELLQNQDIALDLVDPLRSDEILPPPAFTLPVCTFHVHAKNLECKYKLAPKI